MPGLNISMTDPKPILDEFANRANKYCINLNGKITRDQLAFRGGFAAVYQGTLQETGFQVAVKTVCWLRAHSSR